MDLKQEIIATTQDLVSDFLYYDRKEDEDLDIDTIPKAIKDGVIELDEIVKVFRDGLINSLA